MSTWIALLERLACESIAPLGVPVVPPVYCSSARSPVSSWGSGLGVSESQSAKGATSGRSGIAAIWLRRSVRSARLLISGSISESFATASISSEEPSSTFTAVGSSAGASSVTSSLVPESSTC